MRNPSGARVFNMVLMGLMTCLVIVTTMFIKIPIPMTQGYVHLGDSMIFLAVLILGKKNGSIAAGIGSAMGDILGGYAFWAPWTLVIKFVMAFILGLFVERFEKRGELIGMVLAGTVMTAGYYVVSSVMYGSWIVTLADIPWNIGQFAVGMIIAEVLYKALVKTPARKFFVN